MATATQEFVPSGTSTAGCMFPAGGRNILKNFEFLKTFGNGSTNDKPIETQESTKPFPQGSALGINTDDSVFFDFEPQSTDTSLFQNPFPTPGVTDIAAWNNDMNLRPLSPPDSASFSPKEWSFNFPTSNTPGNILTNIQPDNVRNQYGQVTPPDDDNESLFDQQLREQQEQQAQAQAKLLASPSRKSKGSSTSSKDIPNIQTPAKRIRKYATRNSKTDTTDLNNPADVRRSKFLERNRVAASKCRQKKKEWTQNLETRARELQKNNSSLRMMVESLREEVLFLKSECKEHVGCDCREIQNFMNDSTHFFHDSHVFFKKEPVSPVASAPHSRVGSVDYASSYGSEGASAKEMADDENTLEALLTSSIEQDRSDQGIKSKVGG
ncbi:MAG: hypothetical protein Q9164_001484 [Protoblastenia rupestris]